MKRLICSLLLSAVLFAAAHPQSADVRKQQYNIDRSGLALQGYDPVAYFTAGKAIEGSRDISYTWQGITYRFSTAADRDAFKANPGKYEPQYGGWCAYAMGTKGDKVEVDPGTFKIVDGKLYLFYNKFFNNTLKSWNKDEGHLKADADRSWTRLVR